MSLLNLPPLRRVGTIIKTRVPADILTLFNDVWLKARNYADSASINLFKLNTDDEIEVGAALIGAAGTFEELKGKIAELIQASTDTITAAEMASTIINNYGQGAANTQTLPAAAEGLNALFIIATTGNAFHIDVQATDKVYLDGVTLDDGDKISNATPALGDSISIVAFQTGAAAYDWRAQTIQGTWVDGGA